MVIQNYIIEMLRYLLIPLVIAFVSYYLAKRQLNSSNINLFRQRWMEDLRSNVSLFIAKAETISIIDLDDDEAYMKHFQELVQTQMKVELLLDSEEEDHNKLIEEMDKLRDLIHEKEINDEKVQDSIYHILESTKDALYNEWMIIKKA